MPRPRTLDRSSFMELQRSKGIRNPSYEKYLSFLANRRGQIAQQRQADPFAPTPEPRLRSQVEESARAQVDPIIEAILGDTDRSAAAIEGVTDRYAGQLSGAQQAAQGIFGRATESTSRVAEALSDRLAGRGGEAAGGLTEALSQINAPARQINEVAGLAQTQGTGAANAGFAIQSGALEELISRGAGAEEYAEALPGFARGQGLGAIGDLRSESQRDIRDIRGKVPALVADLLEKARDRELRKAELRETFGITRQELGLKRTGQRLDYETDLARIAAQNRRAANAEAGRNERARLQREHDATQAQLARLQRAKENAKSRAQQDKIQRQIEARQRRLAELKAKLKAKGGSGNRLVPDAD